MAENKPIIFHLAEETLRLPHFSQHGFADRVFLPSGPSLFLQQAGQPCFQRGDKEHNIKHLLLPEEAGTLWQINTTRSAWRLAERAGHGGNIRTTTRLDHPQPCTAASKQSEELRCGANKRCPKRGGRVEASAVSEKKHCHGTFRR